MSIPAIPAIPIPPHLPNGAPPPPKRARTYSQPPSPDTSRPTSPRSSDVKPTRIPVPARTRTASASSHAHSIAFRADSRNGTNHRPHHTPVPDTSQDHSLAKSAAPQPTTPPMVSVRHQPSSIMNEPPPFSTPQITSSMRSRRHDFVLPDPRPSNDSEERPFEHWYRGDVHRNGGVGELRVAKHVEMLQIANYGHNLRMAIRGQTASAHIDSPRARKRADSVGAGTHESLDLDDDRTTDVAMVFDESPLTDIEADHDIDPETFYDAYAGVGSDPDDTVSSDPPLPAASVNRSPTPTSASPVLDTNTLPKRTSHDVPHPARSATPSALPRASADSAIPIQQTSGPRSRSMSGTTSPSSDQSHTIRRAKITTVSSPASTPRKPRPKAKTSPPTSQDLRTSIAVYPTPEGDIMNAIPTWTQPVQKSGNWDEVVLPVVARKKGLDGLYEQADGSPKPKSLNTPTIKPAPGTFGYDYTKYRPPRRNEAIPMSEFGLIPEDVPLPDEDNVPPRPETPPKPLLHPLEPEEPIRSDPRKAFTNPPDSPAPFSQYRIDQPQVPTINVTRPSCELDQRRQRQEEDDVTGGCCKCIVM